MVMADKLSLVLRNGRRSGGPSPNSEHSDGSGDEVPENVIRIGEAYQAVLPSFNPGQKYDSESDSMIVWAPTTELSDAKVDEYITVAKEKHGYNMEQALGMLYWHNYDLDKALTDLANFTPFPDEWTVEDKVMFEQAFSFYGKQFHRIAQMLPDKPIPSLVKYFYSWKTSMLRTSQMDRRVRKRGRRWVREELDEGEDSESNNSPPDLDMKEEEENKCLNCGLHTTQLHVTSQGSMCTTCYQHWRRTGEMRTAGPKRHESTQGRHNPIKHKRRPPKGMHLDGADLHTMVTASPAHIQTILRGLDSDIASFKRKVQNSKQLVSLQKHKLGKGVEDFRPPKLPVRINSRWSNEELLLAAQGVGEYGTDFQAIAELIGNKQEVHVRSFFINYRYRYNLDEVLANHKEQRGAQSRTILPGNDDDDVTVVSCSLPTTSSISSMASAPSSIPTLHNTVQVESGEGREGTLPPRPGSQFNSNTMTGNTTHLLPPPLLSHAVPPTTATSIATMANPNSRVTAPQKTILHQPPPLIRPSPTTTLHNVPKTSGPGRTNEQQ